MSMANPRAELDICPASMPSSRNPLNGEVVATYPHFTPSQVEALLQSSAVVFKSWREWPIRERVAAFHRLAAVLRERSAALAFLITTEMGKTLRAARAEVEKCAATLDWIADHGPAILADEPVAVDGADRVHVSFLPIGTVLGVMPWNFPLWQVIRAAGPIMFSGNGFLLKHASNVIGSAYALQDAYDAAGFPKGLFAVLVADADTVTRVIDDRRIAAVTVTGSMRAGASIACSAGKALKKSVLELGGADAFIVLADANIDLAVKAGIEARFQNAGQVCLAAKRFILERPIADEFTSKFLAAAREVRAGNPFDEASTIGPMARDDLRNALHDQVRRSINAGAVRLLGGNKIDGPGCFYEPTVLANVLPGMAAFDEETFGPVAALTIAENTDHAIDLANTSDYGLGGSLWTRDIERAAQLARRLETGGVFINTCAASDARIPVGGVKKSGYGRELSHFGLREFTNAQTVWAKQPG